MTNVSDYRLDASPSPPHFGQSAYDFAIAKAPATRSMFDYGREPRDVSNIRPLGFTRTRLPSSEQISFASDGRFMAPAAESYRHYAPAHSAHEAQRAHAAQYEPGQQHHQSPVRRPQVQPQVIQQASNYHQFNLRNSDLYSRSRSSAEARYAGYMNATLERARYEAEYRRQQQQQQQQQHQQKVKISEQHVY